MPCLSATLQYGAFSGDSFENLIFYLQLILAVVLDRRRTWARILPLNRVSSPRTLTNHNSFFYMNHIVSVLSTGNPRQTTVSDLFRVIVCLKTMTFERSTLWVCVEQLTHSVIAASKTKWLLVGSPDNRISCSIAFFHF
jgi:hypothetical protein